MFLYIGIGWWVIGFLGSICFRRKDDVTFPWKSFGAYLSIFFISFFGFFVWLSYFNIYGTDFKKIPKLYKPDGSYIN